MILPERVSVECLTLLSAGEEYGILFANVGGGPCDHLLCSPSNLDRRYFDSEQYDDRPVNTLFFNNALYSDPVD